MSNLYRLHLFSKTCNGSIFAANINLKLSIFDILKYKIVSISYFDTSEVDNFKQIEDYWGQKWLILKNSEPCQLTFCQFWQFCSWKIPIYEKLANFKTLPIKIRSFSVSKTQEYWISDHQNLAKWVEIVFKNCQFDILVSLIRM